MTPQLPPMPQDDAAESWARPAQPVQVAPAQQQGSKAGGILSTLLGWKHREDVQKRETLARFYADNIHSAYNDVNNRTPDEVLVTWGNELGKLIGHPDAAKAIKSDIQRHLDSRNAGKALAQVNATQAQGQRGMGVPAKPAQQPGDDAGPMQSLPAPPFVDGGQAGGPAPLAGEPPAMQAMGDNRGVGMGIPPMPTPQAAPAPSGFPRLAAGRLSYADVATQKAQADIAGQRVLMQFGQERVTHAMEMLKAMGRDPSKLNDTQIASFITNGTIPAPDWHDIARGAIGVQNTGGGPTIISGQQEPTPIPIGGGLYVPAPVGGAPPGVPWRPGQAPTAGGQAPGPNAMQSPPVGIAAPQPVASGAGPMGSVSRNPDGSSVISGGPPIDAKQRTANLAWEAKHGKPITADKYGEALSELGESAITPTTRIMNESLVANRAEQRKMRQVQEAHLQQTIREFNLTKGPEAIDTLASQVHENPDLLQKLNGDVYNLVSQRYQAKYQTPPPKPIPAELKNREDASFIALNNVNRINELLKNPVIQQRMGVWGGNLGNLEQTLGTTVGLSDQDARAIQAFRSSVNYLFAQEAKSIFSGRPPQKLMDEIKASSPKMKMGLPLFQGAMDAVKATGENNLKSADDVRYNRKPGLTPPPTGNVYMRSPDGQVSEVAAKDVQHYKDKGAVVIQKP